MLCLLALPLIASLAWNVAAHGGVWNYSIAGTWYQGYFPYLPAEGQSSLQRHWGSFNPITNMSSPLLVCNDPGTFAEQYVVAPAGSEIKVYYRGWPHNMGPVLTWMAYCGPEPTSCSNFTGIGKHWFKIDQAGLMSGPILDGWWGQRQLQFANDTWNVTIPNTLRQGAYLYRTELVSLHIPFVPEFYPECAHFWVTGTGTEVPGEEYLAEIPGVYTPDLPELNIDVYADSTSLKTEWKIPGPPVWRGSGQ